MRARIVLVVVSSFVACLDARADAQDEVLQAQEDMRQAFLHADGSALDRLLSDSWKVVHVNGRLQSKAQFIESLKSGRAKFLSIAIDQPEVRVYGGTAIVTARWSNSIEFKGERTSGNDRVTTVWMREGQSWRDIADHASFIEESADKPVSPGTSKGADAANANSGRDEAEVLRLEKTLQDAWLKHDVAAVSAIVADDLQYWSFKGSRRGKADLLKNVAQNGEATTQVDDPQVRVFGDTAIYTAKITDAGEDANGMAFKATTMVTTVFVRRNGKWQMVQDHESFPLPDSSPTK
jgi:uncharacterized protein (TIGR02246 family)